MIRHIQTFFILGLMLFALSATTHAQRSTVGVQFAVGMPTGDMSQRFSTGIGVQGTYLYRLNRQVQLSGSLAYKSFSHEYVDGSLGTIPVLLGIRYGAPTGGVKPYIGGELGLHVWDFSYGETGGDSGTGFGLAPMFGLTIPAGVTMLDIALRYDFLFAKEDYGWFGINLGLLFAFE